MRDLYAYPFPSNPNYPTPVHPNPKSSIILRNMSADTNPGNGKQDEGRQNVPQTPVEVARNLMSVLLNDPERVRESSEKLMTASGNLVLLMLSEQTKESGKADPTDWTNKGIAFAFLYYAALSRIRGDETPVIGQEALLGVQADIGGDIKRELTASEFMTSDLRTEWRKGVHKIYFDTDQTLINSMMAVCIDPKWGGSAPLNTRTFLEGGVLVDRLIKKQTEIDKHPSP